VAFDSSSGADMPSRVVVIGVGNPMRGDDGAGRLVLDRLRGRVPAGVDLVECDGDPAALLEAWTGRALALVVDATSSDAEPGTVRRIDAGEADDMLHDRRRSTHGLGLAEAVALGRALQRFPERLVVFGVEGRSFDTGAGPRAEIVTAAKDVADRVAAEIERINGGPGERGHALR
jgi:hydrogenase maturation protease